MSVVAMVTTFMACFSEFIQPITFQSCSNVIGCQQVCNVEPFLANHCLIQQSMFSSVDMIRK